MRAVSSRFFLGVLLAAGAVFLGFAAAKARGEVVREGNSSPAGAEGAPAGEGERGADERPPDEGAEALDSAADALRLEALRLRFAAWTGSGEPSSEQGLSLRGVVLPDALAYKTLDGYLDLRKGGLDHEAAVERLAKSLERWERYDGRALILLELANEKYEVGPESRRIYTLQESLQREGITIHGEKRRRKLFRLPFALGGKPAGLRIARLRIKKFWKTADGVTRRVTPREQALLDPASIGREPVLSRPFAGLVIEGEPVELELLVHRKAVERRIADEYRVALHHWKRYEGPFEKGILDLNQGRPWKKIPDVAFTVSLPPSGITVSPEVVELVAEVREEAKARRDRGRGGVRNDGPR